MREPRTPISADPARDSHPVVLKNKGPYRTFAVTIGEVRLELWDYSNVAHEPYACLILPGDGDVAAARVVLDQWHASGLVVAIDCWVDSLERGKKGLVEQGLTAEIATLRLRLLGRSPAGPEPRAELTVLGADGRPRTVHLTWLEASLLAEALWCIVPEEQADEA
jgi:hypothetical protein